MIYMPHFVCSASRIVGAATGIRAALVLIRNHLFLFGVGYSVLVKQNIIPSLLWILGVKSPANSSVSFSVCIPPRVISILDFTEGSTENLTLDRRGKRGVAGRVFTYSFV